MKQSPIVNCLPESHPSVSHLSCLERMKALDYRNSWNDHTRGRLHVTWPSQWVVGSSLCQSIDSSRQSQLTWTARYGTVHSITSYTHKHMDNPIRCQGLCKLLSLHWLHPSETSFKITHVLQIVSTQCSNEGWHDDVCVCVCVCWVDYYIDQLIYYKYITVTST